MYDTPCSKSPLSIHATPRLARHLCGLGRAARVGMLLAGGTLAGPALAQSADGGTKADKSCAMYGADFRKAPGSESCVRMGAAVRMDTYRGTTLGSAPNQAGSSPSSGSTSTTTDAVDPWKSSR